MAGTMQQEQQKAAFPEIRDTADSYAEYEEEPDTLSEQADPAIDVEIENMVWEVESEPADDAYEAEDHYSGEAYRSHMDEDRSEYTGRPDVYEEIPYARRMNKHIFTWVFNFVCGMYGVDRFVRGQVALGILKLLTFGGLGFWYLADLGIAIYKSYMEPGAEMQDDLHFDVFGRYV
jgi:TM2 domain-containing membrane protein YozV